MGFADEIDALQKHFHELALHADDDLTDRYFLRRPRRPPGLYWQMRWIIAMVMRWLEAMGAWRPDPWPVVLKQSATDVKAKPLLIWAVGTDRETLRDACEGFSRLRRLAPDFAPVLITDVADFAYFSRLGWLVEYLPRLVGEGELYEDRKLRFLARMYRGASVLPVSAGLRPDEMDDVLRFLNGPQRNA